ncbi:MAG: methyltransferase [bacterium]|nr:methyltransferase [bacterium]
MQENAYDITPYESRPYSQTHPEHLYTLARLFGMEPPEYSTARILELGCAGGGNIIPVAYYMPGSEVVGVDLSRKEIDEGLKNIDALGLTNIALKHCSIIDIDESFGFFDYIICHGVFSWVPEEVREKIMAICRDHLTPQGVAYISYNTLPGWNMVKSIRDMMLYHVKNIDEPGEKTSQARGMLEFIQDALKGGSSSYGTFLDKEIDIVSRHPDYYLLHDHLAEVNTPLYFHEFIESAKKHDLRYLSDDQLAGMFLHNLPERVAEKLNRIKDLVTIGQYIDFIVNQRFRRTLLCRKDAKINRNIKIDALESFYISYNGKDVGEVDETLLKDGVEMPFIAGKTTFDVSSNLSKRALLILTEKKKKPILYDHFCEEVMERCGISDREEVRTHLNTKLNLVRALFGGLINIHSTGGDYRTDIPEKPEIPFLARFQSRQNTAVTNMRHENVKLEVVERIMVQHMDGTLSLDEITAKMCEYVYNGRLTLLSDEGNKIEDKDEIVQKMKITCRDSVERFAGKALFA